MAKSDSGKMIKSPVSVYQTADIYSQYKLDDIAVEVPVALVYNYISHAVMMATPDNLEEFAIGFSLTEEIVNNRDEITHIHVHQGQNGITVRIQITDEPYQRLKDRRRNLVGRTGCGLCGTETLKQAIRSVHMVDAPEVSDKAIQQAIAEIKMHQVLQQMTGATHAVAWCDLDGNVLLVREDVGRHNALDKIIGCLENASIDKSHGFIVTTSRASYEMVQKSTQVGIGCLVAVSAPTSLAIEIAQQAGLLLVGFARQARHVIYNAPKQDFEHQAIAAR